jgi:formate dehydrogenase iron-sulfur subunit
MTATIFVPRDSAALSVGADQVAASLVTEAARLGKDIKIVRNGSRGLFWLEPLIEVATPRGRIAYGPVAPHDVASLFASNFLNGSSHPLCHGLTEAIQYLKKQERLTFARVGITDPLSLDDYLAHDGYRGLKNALEMDGAAIVDAVTNSGLRGRGGAAFPTGIKWKTVLKHRKNMWCATPTRVTPAHFPIV